MSALVKELVEAGVHYGHRASRWNPKMRPYIYGKRNLIHIIDLRETVRGPDACFRWGGDEFALVLPSTDRASADRVAARVSRAVESGVALPSGSPLRVRCGSAQFQEGMDAEDLLNAADAALIAAKGRGPDAGAAAG